MKTEYCRVDGKGERMQLKQKSGIWKAVARGQQRTKVSLQKKRERAVNNATASKLIMCFREIAEQHGWVVPLLTKKDENMMHGFVKLAKNNGKTDKWLFNLMEQLVLEWDELINKEHLTLNGKPYHLGFYPNLRDFLICRESILAYLEYNVDVQTTTVGHNYFEFEE